MIKLFKNTKKRRFGLIELLIVIIVIIVLGSIIKSKKIKSEIKESNNIEKTITNTDNVINQSKLINMKKDITLLSSSIEAYEIQYDELPIRKENIFSNETLLDCLVKNNDNMKSLRIIDLNKTKEFHTKLSLGYEKEINDRYLFSLKTNIIYYEKGISDVDNNIIHTN